MERIKVDREKNEVILSFNDKFYDKRFVDKAIEEFKQVCDIKRDNCLIVLRPKEKIDLNTLGFEFYNYVLGLIKTN